MDSRRTTLLIVLLLVLATDGCAVLRYFDNSSPEEIKRFQTPKEDLWDRTRSLEQQRAAYEKRLAEQQAELTKVNKSLSEGRAEITQANREVNDLNRAMNRLIQKQRDEALASPSPLKTAAPPPTAPATEGLGIKTKDIIDSKDGSPEEANPLEPESLKIKILASGGNGASATGLAKSLEEMGYRVGQIDKNLQSDFEVHTLYYRPEYRAAARVLADKLGGNSIAVPINWQSDFDIVIAAGKSRN